MYLGDKSYISERKDKYMENLTEIWNKVLDIIKPEFSSMQVSYTTWIETIIPTELSQTHLKIKVPYEYNRDMINLRYSNLIKNALQFVTGRNIELDITVNTETEVKKEKANIENTNLNPLYTFDSFIIGKSNQLAHATSFAIAEGRVFGCNPLFLYGGVGLGKTHLMHAVGNYVLKQNPNKKIIYVSSEQFTNDMINAIRTDRNQEFRDKYRTADILLVDDIQFICDKEGVQEEFFHTFNELYQNNKIIIITADRPPKDLPTFMDRLKTRFECGPIIDINPPDYETRIAILRNKAYQLNLDIPDEVFEFIAKRIKSNIRELEGAIKKIMLHHMLIKKEINISLAEESLKDIINEKKQKITPDLIISTVEKHFNLRENDLKSKSRSHNISYPRQIAMYILKNELSLSLKQIGDLFGGKDHSTVIHAIKTIEEEKRDDSNVEKIIEDILKDIKI